MLEKMLRLRRDLKQYAYISDALQTGLDLNSDFTIECDFITMNNSVCQDLVMKWGRDSNQRSWDFSIPSSLGMQISSDGTFNNSTGAYVPWVPSNGILYHLATVYDMSEGSGTFYVNGIQIGTTQFGLKTSILNGTEAVCIGTYNQVSGGMQSECLDGFIGNVRVWNDKRTQQEIFDNIGVTLNGDEENIVACWDLNGDYLDKTNNGNNLTPYNSPIFVDFNINNSDYRKFSLNTNGENNSNIFIDDFGHIITSNGNTKIDATQNIMGGNAAFFDGINDSLSVPYNSDFDLGAEDNGNFTVYFKVATLSNAIQGFVCPYTTSTNNGWQIYYDGNGNISLWSGAGTTRSVRWNHSLNTCYYICVSRIGKIINIYSNGNLLGSATDGNFNCDGSKLIIGAINSSNNGSLNGWIKDLIILKGVGFIPTPENYSLNFNHLVLSLNLTMRL